MTGAQGQECLSLDAVKGGGEYQSEGKDQVHEAQSHALQGSISKEVEG